MGSSTENYQVRDVADIVRDVVPGCSVRYMEGGGPDPRCYRVSCDKLSAKIPGFRTRWTVRRGAEELHASYVANHLTGSMFSEYFRLKRIQALLGGGRLDSALRWRCVQATT